jgi:hypothetical protein
MRDAVALYGREVTLLSQMRAVALLSLDGQLNLATFRAYTSQQSIDGNDGERETRVQQERERESGSRGHRN